MICWVCCKATCPRPFSVCYDCRAAAADILLRESGELLEAPPDPSPVDDTTDLLALVGRTDTARLARSMLDDPTYSDRL